MAKKTSPVPELDSIDYAILAAISEQADITNKALAHRLRVAESTSAYRVRNLRERGIIQGSHIRLNNAALGYPLEALIKVRLRSHSRESVGSFYDDLVNTPGVLQAVHLAGADDFLVHVAVEDAEAVRDLVLQRITSHGVVRQTETSLVFEVRHGVGVVPSSKPPRSST